jgi:superfamily I DNA and/or RNA helicase
LNEFFLSKTILILLLDTFSHIFIDEASSMLEAESLCPIALAGERTRVIVCGDLMILEPEMFASDTTELLHHPTLVERMDKLYPARHPLRFKLEEVYGNHKDIAQVLLLHWPLLCCVFA